MFRATALVYSSHNRCSYIHRDWIVERALQNPFNKTILYLPMSMSEGHQQEYTWGTFRWYFDQFRKWGLDAIPFFWNPNLRKEDVDLLFHYLHDFEVVILGGGGTTVGLQRYKNLGGHFYGDHDLFGRILHQRQQNGKLTAGFSAGADQLGEFISTAVDYDVDDSYGFGLARNVTVTLHFSRGDEGVVRRLAQKWPQCMAFGLPNDSGIAVDQGYLPSGNFWQIMEFLIDCSWDIPQDGWHIKTRQGVRIQHSYPDGREWVFNGGDKIVRVISADGQHQKAWMVFGNTFLDYWTQQGSGYSSISQILNGH